MSDERRYTATITAVVQYNVEGVWGGDTTVEQVRDQAQREGRAQLENMLSNSGSRVRRVRSLDVSQVSIQPERDD